MTLGLALGVRGVVKKTRRLIMIGQTRVHIDDVEGLGTFMELEVTNALYKENQTIISSYFYDKVLINYLE